MADSRVILSIRDLQIDFGDTLLFDGTNLDVHEDDFIMITTGVMDGATTLMKSILGLVDIAAGKIIFEGNDILQPMDRVKRRLSRQQIGLVYEAGGLISIMNVYQNLSLPLSYHKSWSDQQIAEKIDYVAEDLGITDLLYLEPNELNDTQTRVVNLARALVIEPRLLLIDELEGGMTAEMLQQMIKVIQHYQKQYHFGVVMTSLQEKVAFSTAHYTIRNKKLEVDHVR